MTEQKRQPMGKVILWMLIGSAVFSLIFGSIITLTSDFTFIGATSFVFIALMAIFIPTFTLMPLWEKLSTKAQENVRNWSIGLLLLAIFVLGPTGMFGGSTWSGEGEVNLFPEGAASKNYRVAAEMKVTTKWWWQKEYKISSVSWPDGGTSYIGDCTITGSNNVCSDDEGRDWTIEIVQTPDRSSD